MQHGPRSDTPKKPRGSDPSPHLVHRQPWDPLQPRPSRVEVEVRPTRRTHWAFLLLRTASFGDGPVSGGGSGSPEPGLAGGPPKDPAPPTRAKPLCAGPPPSSPGDRLCHARPPAPAPAEARPHQGERPRTRPARLGPLPLGAPASLSEPHDRRRRVRRVPNVRTRGPNLVRGPVPCGTNKTWALNTAPFCNSTHCGSTRCQEPWSTPW